MTRLWRACDEPERPTDPYVTWCVGECQACAIKLGVVLNQLDPTSPDDQTQTRVAHGLLDRVAPQEGRYD